MKGLLYLGAAITAGSIGLTASALGAAPLSKDEVTTLIVGSRITQRIDDPSAQGTQYLEYQAGGDVTRVYSGGKHAGYRESGRWQVNPDGRLCVTWQGKNKPNCAYLVPTGRGGYHLTPDPAKRGKMEITGVSKVK